eukprot:TRINITY_DN9508_c0_g1_i1.p1 TRINITY_DN9508_c0_g1~~TRINITY_DN9508_c0_g1_i1.p1  ORF type:complete len:209 (+),score=37.08 TRINITY_DN9508_c0_g1_i1:192-818(+)
MLNSDLLESSSSSASSSSSSSYTAPLTAVGQWLGEGTAKTRADALLNKPRQKLIVAASLLDNVPNIAGLTRTSEIFGVGELAIANKKLLKEKAYQHISVTSECWIPITEVPRTKLGLYLQEKKTQGYTIVGVEQTSSSVSLLDYTFPQKCVLVVGHENCGMPAEYLRHMDQCVQIPQLGVIRSLNAHVSMAVTIFECTRQFLNSKKTN